MFWWVYKVTLVSNFVRISWQKKLVRCPSRSPKYQRWPLPHLHLPRRHLPHRQNAWKWSCQWRSGFSAKLLSYWGWRFCLHRSWVDMFQFLMSWCCLGFKFANTLWKCWTWVQAWSLRNPGQCLSSVLLYWFSLCWIFLVMLWMQPLPPTVSSIEI